MYCARHIDKYLLEWKNSAKHKPLLLRGARQVGKSSAIQHLGESFDYFIEVNFEKRKELKRVFVENSNVKEIANRLSTLFNKPVIPGKTLLFIDEIQDCHEAIQSLWAFKEDFPELHVAAAGSLLEFALKEMPSFGVGRIRSMFMYPMSFEEFLTAEGKDSWVKAIHEASYDKPLAEELHTDLVQHFRAYLMVGGMPASVMTWVETQDYLQCADEQEDIQQTYYDDFVKYAKKIDPQLLRNTLHAVVMQAGKKFVYNRVEGGYKTDDIKKALGMLCDAGIIKLVQHTAANGLPLGAEINDKFRKYIYLDTGLMLRILDLELGGAQQYSSLILAGAAEELVNKGGITEMVVGWEIVKNKSPRTQHDLFYWENLSEGTTSEVDYILAQDMKVLPLEVKSGISGKMKSLRLFMKKKHLDMAVRSSLENFGKLTFVERYDDTAEEVEKQIVIHPIYAISSLFSM